MLNDNSMLQCHFWFPTFGLFWSPLNTGYQINKTLSICYYYYSLFWKLKTKIVCLFVFLNAVLLISFKSCALILMKNCHFQWRKNTCCGLSINIFRNYMFFSKFVLSPPVFHVCGKSRCSKRLLFIVIVIILILITSPTCSK